MTIFLLMFNRAYWIWIAPILYTIKEYTSLSVFVPPIQQNRIVYIYFTTMKFYSLCPYNVYEHLAVQVHSSPQCVIFFFIKICDTEVLFSYKFCHQISHWTCLEFCKFFQWNSRDCIYLKYWIFPLRNMTLLFPSTSHTPW